MKILRRRSYILIGYFWAAVSTGCQHDVTVPENEMSEEGRGNFTPDQIRSLQSTEKIDEYPLFSMIYYGDYGMHDYFWNEGMPQDYIPSTVEKTLNDSILWGCTCFTAMGDTGAVLFGRNFDYFHRPSLLLYTDPPEGFASVSMVDLYYCGYLIDTPVTSVEDRRGFLRAPYYPFDGLNEQGVSIGLMAVSHWEPPYEPGKKSIYDLAVLRLVLDYARDTEQAIDLINQFNVTPGTVPLHFLIADRHGHSAIVEFVQGDMKVFRNQNDFHVCTNFIVDEVSPILLNRCLRYDRAHQWLSLSGGSITTGEAGQLLEEVSAAHTMWSVVYNLSTGDFKVSAGRQYAKWHVLSLSDVLY